MGKRAWAAGAGVVLAAAAVLGLAGCQSLAYYAQSVGGHLRLMNAAQPVEHWLADPATPAALQDRLRAAQHMRAFASQTLHLPDNASYRRYADLGRRAAVWNVAAAPANSLQLKTWCFVVLGCVSYRGYFDEAHAQALGASLRAQGWEVDVYPVPAYSTLGWLNWLGGDPLLSTFIGYPEASLAGLIFHELAHQQLYVDDDSAFNESFATAVEHLGLRQWLATQPEAMRRSHAQSQRQRQAFRALQQRTRQTLAEVYAQTHLSAEVVQQRKTAAMQAFVQAHEALKAQWAARGEPHTRFDAWVAKANNASFGMQGVYQGWVPAFEALFVREGCDWRRFYAAAQALAVQPRARRDAQLRALQPADGDEAHPGLSATHPSGDTLGESASTAHFCGVS